MHLDGTDIMHINSPKHVDTTLNAWHHYVELTNATDDMLSTC